jgi:hypothetical protein
MTTARHQPPLVTEGVEFLSAAFPERAFPPASGTGDRFLRDCRRGYSVMARSRVAITGLARNLGRVLPLTISRIEALACCFADYRVVVYENDSTDDTPAVLRRWAADDSRVTVTCADLSDPVNPGTRCPARAERMAAYRRRCQEGVLSACAGFDFAGVRHTKTHGNPLTGPFYIEGAEPGDALIIHLEKVRLNRDTGGDATHDGQLQRMHRLKRHGTTWRIDLVALDDLGREALLFHCLGQFDDFDRAGAVGQTADEAALLQRRDQAVDARLRPQFELFLHFVERGGHTVHLHADADEVEQFKLLAGQHGVAFCTTGHTFAACSARVPGLCQA